MYALFTSIIWLIYGVFTGNLPVYLANGYPGGSL